jgi:hypothetical protein
MTRCQMCDGIIARADKKCFSCGEKITGRSKPMSTGHAVAMVVMFLLIASAGASAAFFYLS